MSISTKETPQDRRDKIRNLRDFHQNTLDSIHCSDAKFIPKMAYKPIGKTEIHIGFFENELNQQEDLFVEFCSREYVPEDHMRTLYRWIYNPHFKEEYDITEPNATTGHVRYLVPIAELKVIKKYEEKEIETKANTEQKSLQFELPDPETDLPLDQMTIRDFAAIMLKKPVSRKEWINDLIK